MILENGVIRTMDASLPVQRARAIAGDRVAGGIGTHETALASPDVVDLGGRCVLPGFTGLACPLPDLGARAAAGAAPRESALWARRSNASEAAVPDMLVGNVLRGFGWRDADWAGGADQASARRCDGLRP